MEHANTETIPVSNALQETHTEHLLKGIGFALSAFFLFAVMSAAAKVLSETHHVAEIAFYRNAIFFIPLLLFMLSRQSPALFKTKKPKGVAFRAIIGAISLITTYGAFAQLPMADTTVLLFTSSLITPVIVHFALREHVGIYRWAAIVIGLCGVMLMAAPTGTVNPLGVGLALAAATMHAMMYATLRYLKTEDSLTVTFYFILAGVLIPGLFFMPFVAAPIQDLKEAGLFLLLGIAGGCAQLCLANAHRHAPASLVAPMNYTGLIWATLFDITIWAKVPGWPVFAGGAVIITSSLFIVYRENRAKHLP